MKPIQLNQIYIEIVLGKKSEKDRRIVMDNISGLADSSKKICKFFNSCKKI